MTIGSLDNLLLAAAIIILLLLRCLLIARVEPSAGVLLRGRLSA